MVGLVIVSHSAALAEGVVELAREMGGEEVRLEAAGGLEDGAVGTDAERVMAAIERARSQDGVLVLMDLGSALMSAEMAVEMSPPDGGEIVLSEAPLVEGAVAAAAVARAGASLAEVAAEARGALRAKATHLGAAEQEGGDEPAAVVDGVEARLQVDNRLGLHARPAARFVGALAGLEAAVSVRNLTRETGPADGRSLTAIAVLNVRQGDEILVAASGPDAPEALRALEALAAENWGDEDGGETPAAVASPPATASPATAPSPGATLRGVAASAGIAVGPARRLTVELPEPEATPAGTAEEEWARLQEARAGARADLAAARARVTQAASAAEGAIFDAHAALLDDPQIVDAARRQIDAGQSAASAWHAAAQEAAAAFRGAGSQLLRERAVDVEDVARRVGARLAGVTVAAGPTEAGIVIADELTPGEAAGLDRALVRGIATARGGATAHAAILARALGIPAVVGLGGALLALDEGTPLVLDGAEGTVLVDPPEDVVAASEQRRAAQTSERAALLERAREPGALADGERIEVFANLGGPAEVAAALEHGAEGVGLLRTEFLFLDRDEPPGEDEQAETLEQIARGLQGRPLVVRTLDAGADKPLAFLRQPPEDNPFLGVRGIRLSLAQPELLHAQLRAVLRVAARHPLKLMFPMVATLDELLAARAALDAARRQLDSLAPLEVGVMVEVPALALAAAQVAPHVDFFSIGTNDLAQYTMAAERGNARLAELLDGPLPPVLALIERVCEAARRHGAWVGVCGELAGDPEAAVLLAGLGVTELSMAASRIPAVKAALRAVDTAAAQGAARGALAALDPQARPTAALDG